MQNNTSDLRGYVNDMLAVETELHAAFRRQKDDAGIAAEPRAHAIVARTEDLIDRHLTALRQCATRLGGEESSLKSAVGSVMGAAAGMYDKLRGDSPASRALRDDYAAISFATVSYEMLHTTALVMKDAATADLALRHLADFAPIVVALSEAMPKILVDELAAQGKGVSDSSVATEAARNTKHAWASASTNA